MKTADFVDGTTKIAYLFVESQGKRFLGEVGAARRCIGLKMQGDGVTRPTRLIQNFDFREAFYDIDEERVPCPFAVILEVYNHLFLAGFAPADNLVFQNLHTAAE